MYIAQESKETNPCSEEDFRSSQMTTTTSNGIVKQCWPRKDKSEGLFYAETAKLCHFNICQSKDQMAIANIITSETT